jgi:integrase
MKTAQTFSILIWANKAKETPSGIPLFARVTVDGKRAEISLKRKVTNDAWNSKTSTVKDTDDEAKRTNQYITHVKAQLLKLYEQMQVLDEDITAENIKLKFTGKTEEIKSLLDIVDYHNNQMEKNVGIDIEKITLFKYKSLRKKLVGFIKFQYKKADYPLRNLNHQFVTNFEYYLKSYYDNSHNTVMKDIKNLKKIINEAVRNQWLQANPFANFKCTYHKVKRNVLTIEEIETIETKAFSIQRLQHVKDLFIFSCYTGISYCDVMRLSPSNITIGIDGKYWISTSRKKTDESVLIPLLPQPLSIIEKYKNHPITTHKGCLLPYYSNQKLNSYLKEIADVCGIEKKLTFHLARHTFATTITLANGVPMETVSKLLGHSSIKTTEIYAKVIEKKISEDMNMLRNKLFKEPKVKLIANGKN